MTLLGLLALLVIGAVCGALAQLITGYSAGGFLTSAAIGIVGSFVGTWLAAALHLPTLFVVNVEGVRIEVVWAVIGAAVFLAVIALIRRRPRHSYG